jgi:hypothetical protein
MNYQLNGVGLPNSGFSRPSTCVVSSDEGQTQDWRPRNDAVPSVVKPLDHLGLNSENPAMKFLALAGLATLLVIPVERSDEPTAQSAVSAEIPKSNDQTRRPEETIAKRYEQIRAEFEAQLAAQRSAASKAEGPREKTAAAAKTISDLVVDYCRRMVDLAESSPDEPAARDALLWVMDNAGRGDVRADDIVDKLLTEMKQPAS